MFDKTNCKNLTQNLNIFFSPWRQIGLQVSQYVTILNLKLIDAYETICMYIRNAEKWRRYAITLK